jgi:hypothetical protein
LKKKKSKKKKQLKTEAIDNEDRAVISVLVIAGKWYIYHYQPIPFLACCVTAYT